MGFRAESLGVVEFWVYDLGSTYGLHRSSFFVVKPDKYCW